MIIKCDKDKLVNKNFLETLKILFIILYVLVIVNNTNTLISNIAKILY